MMLSEMAAESDTIVSVSTAVGLGAIGIVRLSGTEALPIAEALFRPARGYPVSPDESHRLLYGMVVDPDSGEHVDEALLAVMRAPRTYTREDVVEIHCHGGIVAQRTVLRLAVRMGARLAEPGEFTRRAFMNGRIDLAQAESVAGVVSAKSTAALRSALRRLEGGLSERVRSVRGDLVGLLAVIEATVDFSDEDVEPVDWEVVQEGLDDVEARLERLVRTAFVGRALEQGVRTAIVGKPNVGKSSLLNALLMRERAIVSDVPGTTRDTVEELLEIGGMPIHLVDTAGLRQDGDAVELLGVARSRLAMEQADLVLVVVDLSEAPQGWEEGLFGGLDPVRTIVVGNKRDLLGSAAEVDRRLKVLRDAVNAQCGGPWRDMGLRCCPVSAVSGEGLEELRRLIQFVGTGGEGLQLEEPVLAGERQRALVAEALEATTAARAGAWQGAREELVCEDIRGAVTALGRITGEELTPDLLDEIFSRFCLGK
jgi:tRNA modification GTPase